MSEPGFARKLWSLAAGRSVTQAGAAMVWHAAVAWRGLLRRAGILADVQWAREVMDRETGMLVDRLDPASLHALEISGEKWGRLRRFASYRSEGLPSFDVCSDMLPERFDLVIAEQVWEHLLWPLRATRNVHAMLAEGGHVLITTPFLVRVHEEPHDCTRWTETGLRHLLIEGGFDERHIVTGSWGNRACVRANFSSWPSYNRLTHSLKNEPAFPVVVWALARRAAC